MEKIAIIGKGGFGREVLTLIKAINQNRPMYEIAGFVDYGEKGTLIDGYPIIGTDEDINRTNEPISLVNAVGEPSLKKKIREKYTNPLVKFPTLIHPSVIIGDENRVHFGSGCIICAGNIITTDVVIKDMVMLNLMCTIGHDTIIDSYCSLMPAVNISGEVHICERVYIGTGAKIINRLEIGEYTTIGAGAVVVKDLPARCTAVGVPAKAIKYNV